MAAIQPRVSAQLARAGIHIYTLSFCWFPGLSGSVHSTEFSWKLRRIVRRAAYVARAGKSRAVRASRDDHQKVGDAVPRLTSRLMRAQQMPGIPAQRAIGMRNLLGNVEDSNCLISEEKVPPVGAISRGRIRPPARAQCHCACGSSRSRICAGARPRTAAKELPSFRGFFRRVARDGVIREDPTAEIAMPKIARSLSRSHSRSRHTSGIAHRG